MNPNNQQLGRELMELDGITASAWPVDDLRATITVKGSPSDIPHHVFRIADRYGLTVLLRGTGLYGRGLECTVELATEERVASVMRYEAEWTIDQKAEVLQE